MKKKFSQVFKSIRFAKLDPNHDKGPKGSTDDEEHYAIGEKEWEQQLAHAKKRAIQEDTVDEARMSAAVKLQRAFQREQQKSAASRERAKELLQPKKPEPVKEDIEQLDEIGNTSKGQKLLQLVNRRAVARVTSKKAETDPVYAKKAQQTHLAADERLKEDTVSEAYNTVSPSSYDDHPMVAFRKKENEKPPFDGPYKKTTGTITDKSGAKHTPMSQARNLARQAMKAVGERQKKSLKPAKAFNESKKTEIVKDIIKGKKTKDKFEAEPIISNSPDTKGTIDN